MNIEDYLWRAVTCPEGEKCWCRRIIAIKNKRGRQPEFVSAGWLHREQAELIVKIHNEWLELVRSKGERG